MDFCPVGLTVQESRLSRADSSMLSQLSFEAGLTETLTDFNDGRLTGFIDRWSEKSASLPLVDRRPCSAVEAIEREAPAGHAQHQQDNHSSSTSSKPRLQPEKALQIRAGKRKAVSGNDDDESTMPSSITSSDKVSEGNNNNSHVRFWKAGGDEEKSTSAEERSTGGELVQSRCRSSLPKSSTKGSSKLLQAELLLHPKQDYIHVRARRGQATDSHSLAERVRREKIGERMKFLQDLVPGCSKVTGKAVMLDEIINYVQSLQRQIEFLSMKLAAVDPQLEVNLETLLNKETQELFVGQARSPETTLLGPDPGAGYREFQAHLHLLHHMNNSNNNNNINMRDVRSSVINSNYAPVQLLPPAQYSEGFVHPFSQTLNGVVCDGDLQTIVHMANSQAGKSNFLSQDQLHGPGFFSPGFLKVEY